MIKELYDYIQREHKKLYKKAYSDSKRLIKFTFIKSTEELYVTVLYYGADYTMMIYSPSTELQFKSKKIENQRALIEQYYTDTKQRIKTMDEKNIMRKGVTI